MGAGHIECGGGYEEVGVGVLMVRLSGCSVGFGVVLGPVGKGAKAKGKGGKSQQGKGAKANRDKAKSCTKRQDAWVLGEGGGLGYTRFRGGSWDIHGKVEMDNVMIMHACMHAENT